MAAEDGGARGGALESWRIAAARAGTHALVVLPPLFVAWVVQLGLRRGLAAVDLMQGYLPAARAVVHGLSPYRAAYSGGIDFVVPPVVAWLAAPFLLLRPVTSELLAGVLVVAALLAVPRLLGVRDWRCYALPFLCVPAYDAIQTANIIVLVGVLCAFAWRRRDHSLAAGAAVGAAIALKLIAWPLLLFFVVTRRYRAAAVAAAAAVVLLLAPWGAIGFRGLAGYPHLLATLDASQRPYAYTIGAVAAPVVGWHAAELLTYLAGLALVVLLVRRRADERAAFTLALALTLELSPIVWLSYLVLLLAALPLARPRLGPLWLLPLGLWLCPVEHPAPWQAALGVAVAAAVLLGGLGRAAAAGPVPAAARTL